MQVGTGKSVLNGIAIGKLKIYKKKGYRYFHRPCGRYCRRTGAF